MTAFTLDQPRDGEAEQLARIHIETWAQTYAGLLPPEHLDERALPGRIAFWERVIASDRADLLVRIARDAEDQPIGFALAGPTREEDGPDLELYALYVHPSRQAEGIGQALLSALLGAQAATLRVAERNPGARDFYARQGFTQSGPAWIDEELGITELRMTRP